MKMKYSLIVLMYLNYQSIQSSERKHFIAQAIVPHRNSKGAKNSRVLAVYQTNFIISHDKKTGEKDINLAVEYCEPLTGAGKEDGVSNTYYMLRFFEFIGSVMAQNKEELREKALIFLNQYNRKKTFNSPDEYNEETSTTFPIMAQATLPHRNSKEGTTNPIIPAAHQTNFVIAASDNKERMEYDLNLAIENCEPLTGAEKKDGVPNEYYVLRLFTPKGAVMASNKEELREKALTFRNEHFSDGTEEEKEERFHRSSRKAKSAALEKIKNQRFKPY